MRWLLKLTPLAISLFLFATAQACDCKPSPPPKEASEQAAAVFSGKVLKIADADKHHWAVTFQVAASWKGDAAKEIVVLTSKDDGLCGYKFKAGASYLVYANETIRDEVKYLATGICHRTKLLEIAEEDLKELGKDKPPE